MSGSAPAGRRAADGLTLVARTTRNRMTECWHQGAVAVVTPEGELVAGVGDAELAAFLRSSAKPFQALPLLEAGGAEEFELEAADVALVCSSHGGGPEHVQRAAALLERGGFGVVDLACGVHRPLDRDTSRALWREGVEPTPLHNNCSGKHAGMLLACRLLGFSPRGYLDPDHPLQRRILTCVAEVCRVPVAEIGVAVDGCGVPAYRMPLRNAALGYAALAAPAAAGVAAERAAAMERVVTAMSAAPEMVAGPGRFTTRLSEVSGGRLLGKEGAKGYYAVAVRGPVAMGVALKIGDGDDVCRDGVVLESLRQLGVLAGAELDELAAFHRLTVRNHAGREVGEVLADLELETRVAARVLDETATAERGI